MRQYWPFLVLTLLLIVSCKKEETPLPESSIPADTQCYQGNCKDDHPNANSLLNYRSILHTITINGKDFYSLAELMDTSNNRANFLICGEQSEPISSTKIQLLGQEFEIGEHVVVDAVVKAQCSTPTLDDKGKAVRFVKINTIALRHCPIEYSQDFSRNDSLRQYWNFVGFQVSADSIDFPPAPDLFG
ncbi:hypothetical protein KFE98_01285 [bacterium SCSIO 12741]|nr:hypothetical protein KFE98_01285 [bacterium SCSIO 12741]